MAEESTLDWIRLYSFTILREVLLLLACSWREWLKTPQFDSLENLRKHLTVNTQNQLFAEMINHIILPQYPWGIASRMVQLWNCLDVQVLCVKYICIDSVHTLLNTLNQLWIACVCAGTSVMYVRTCTCVFACVHVCVEVGVIAYACACGGHKSIWDVFFHHSYFIFVLRRSLSVSLYFDILASLVGKLASKHLELCLCSPSTGGGYRPHHDTQISQEC